MLMNNEKKQMQKIIMQCRIMTYFMECLKTALSEPERSVMEMRACFFPPVSQSMLAFVF